MKLIYRIWLFIVPLVILSCNNEETEPSLPNSPSYRDGIYSGKQLEFSVDGKESITVSSVTLTSRLLDANLDPDKDPDQIAHPSDPTYTTTVSIAGFPLEGDKSSFVTVSNIMGFKGTTMIQNIEYEYVGEFTGDPLSHHENKGLILKLTTK